MYVCLTTYAARNTSGDLRSRRPKVSLADAHVAERRRRRSATHFHGGAVRSVARRADGARHAVHDHCRRLTGARVDVHIEDRLVFVFFFSFRFLGGVFLM